MGGLQYFAGFVLMMGGFASLTFGRDSAHYWRLLTLLGMVSIVLWVFVLITTFIRFGVRYKWRVARAGSDKLSDNRNEDSERT